MIRLGKKILLKKIRESAQAILPISVIILILSLVLGVEARLIWYFLLGDLLLIAGLALFTIGSVGSMISIAESIGEFIVKKRRLWIFVLVAFLVGLMITVAEPALWVLADQFKAVVSQGALILVVAFGVGLFVVVGLVRILTQHSLRLLFTISYLLLFAVAGIIGFINPSFIPIAFDSGGVTTGPMAVPFIMSLGLGISKARGDKSSEEDSFGLIGIASIGPILAVLFLGLAVEPTAPVTDLRTTMGQYFLLELGQMAIAILPFVLFFFVFQIVAFRFSKKRVIQVSISLLYTYVGLVLFLTGANGGLVNLGYALGSVLGQAAHSWVLVPLGMVFGFTVVAAEPSVIAINRQVEEVTAGAISRKFMMVAFSIGVSVALGLACLRILTGISIWWFLLPGYAVTILLSYKTPKIFSSIAFDSGGAVSGAMTSAFLMPYALGAAAAVGTDVLLDAFGLVAFVAMAPLITIQWLGILYRRKALKAVVPISGAEDEIITIPPKEVKP